MHDVGKIAMLPKDVWSSAVEYEFLDIVTYNDSAFVARQNNTGHVPVGNANDNYWMLLVSSSHSGVSTFNGRSGSVLPIAGDYDDSKVILSSTMHISGEDQTTVKEALEALEARPSSTFNGRSGSILPMAGDYNDSQVVLSSTMHMGGESQTNVKQALEALNNLKTESKVIETEEEWNEMTEEEKNDPNKTYFLPWKDSEGSGVGGHTIVDSEDNEFAARTKLKFRNAVVQDDAENDTTIVIPEGGGGGIALGDVEGAAATTSLGTATLTWSDPADIVVSGTTLAKWDGTLIVRKAGSAPASRHDGTVVVTNTVRDQYSSNGYVDSGLTYDTVYYYRFFPYTTQGAYTNGSSVSVTPEREAIAVPVASGTLTYNGSEQTMTFTGYDSSKMTVTGASATNAGSHTATFTPKADYMWSDTNNRTPRDITWIIGAKDVAVPTVTGSFTYDGTVKTCTVSQFDSNEITQDSSSSVSGTNAGAYNVYFNLTNTTNYKWQDDDTTSQKTQTWTIAKANGGCNLSDDSVDLDAEYQSVTITVSNATGTISGVTSSDTTVCTASISGNEITISSVDDTTGTATVTVNIDASANYNAATVTIDVTCTFSSVYGVEWDGTSTTLWSRTDNAAGFTNPVPAVNNGNGSSPFDACMPWSGMEPVNDATVGKLVKIPKYWFKWTRSGSSMKLQISDSPQDGFYVSPAHADRGDGKGERDFVYVGAYHCATSTYKSTTGVMPQASQTRATFRTSIHNLGSDIWQFDFAMYWTICMLYLVEYGDWNSQNTIGYGCSDSGSIQNSGLCDSMIYHTGTNAVNRTTYGHTRYRYIEDLWGNVYDFCDGIYFSSANVYCIKNPTNFSDTSGGTLVGTRATASGWTKAWTNPTTTGFEYALYPNNVDSNLDGSTYVCDFCSYNASGVVLYVGGSRNQNQYLGLFCLVGNYAASYSDSSVGGRLQKLP